MISLKGPISYVEGHQRRTYTACWLGSTSFSAPEHIHVLHVTSCDSCKVFFIIMSFIQKWQHWQQYHLSKSVCYKFMCRWTDPPRKICTFQALPFNEKNVFEVIIPDWIIHTCANLFLKHLPTNVNHYLNHCWCILACFISYKEAIMLCHYPKTKRYVLWKTITCGDLKITVPIIGKHVSGKWLVFMHTLAMRAGNGLQTNTQHSEVCRVGYISSHFLL